LRLASGSTASGGGASPTTSAGGAASGANPPIADGDVVTTSPLADYEYSDAGADSGADAKKRRRGQQIERRYKEGMTVTTLSGSRYRLGRPRAVQRRWSQQQQQRQQQQRERQQGTVDTDDDGSGGARDLFGIRWPRVSLLPNSDECDDNHDESDGYYSADLLPVMDQWRIQWNGRLVGSITDHPVYDDGDVLTTSALTRTTNLQEGDVVTTYSGSQYRLGRKMDNALEVLGSLAGETLDQLGDVTGEGGVVLPELPKAVRVGDWRKWKLNVNNVGESVNLLQRQAVPDNGSSNVSGGKGAPTDNNASGGSQTATKSDTNKNNNNNAKKKKKDANPPAIPPPPPKTAPTMMTPGQRRREATKRYHLTGQTAGRKRSGGSRNEYLISGRPFRTTSGKSNIYTAYISDADGLPVVTVTTTAAAAGRKGGGGGGGKGAETDAEDSAETEPQAEAVAMKVSTNCEALKRENANYDRIISKGYADRFVTKHEFIDKWGGPHFPQRACALVLEAGRQDLKSVLFSRRTRQGQDQGGGLDGPAMRAAALAAARCVEAMHRAGLVWTDLKPENFVATTDSLGCDGDCPLVVKGIDLESAIPRGDTPVDYSPEASPPEFAVDFHDGRALDHVLDFPYDIWSLGMLLYELSTGRSYFETETPAQITTLLSSPDFRVDLRAVKRNRLRNLIGKCLQTDPKKRPSITEVLLHPYFLTTGLGWY